MGGEIKSFRDLIAWQKAMDLCKAIYEFSSRFPDSERFGLTAQIRRASVSIPSNIAEGYGRNRTQDYLRFLDIARGSLCEVETQVLLAQKLEWFSNATALHGDSELAACLAAIRELDRVLYGLVKGIERSDSQ